MRVAERMPLSMNASDAGIACDPLKRFKVILPVMAIGLILIGLAVPRVVAQVSILDVHDLVDAELLPLTDPDPAVDVARAARAVSWQSKDSQLQMELGRRLMRLPDIALDDAVGVRELPRASDAFADGAAAAPNRTELWCYLAMARNAEGAPAKELAPILRLTYLTGPYSSSCALQRVSLIVGHWSGLPLDLQDRAGREIQLLWKTAPFRRPLVQTYLGMDFAERSLVRRFVFASPDDAAAFDAALFAEIRANQRKVAP
jgi:hypothetical protein